MYLKIKPTLLLAALLVVSAMAASVEAQSPEGDQPPAHTLNDPTRPVHYLDSPLLYMIVQSQSICCFARNQQETAH